jgi:hypothetical protein
MLTGSLRFIPFCRLQTKTHHYSIYFCDHRTDYQFFLTFLLANHIVPVTYKQTLTIVLSPPTTTYQFFLAFLHTLSFLVHFRDVSRIHFFMVPEQAALCLGLLRCNVPPLVTGPEHSNTL